MDFEKSISEYKKKIDSRLRIFLKQRISRVERLSPIAKEMMQHLMEFNLRGGKRLRPMLVVIGYKAFGGKDEKAIIDAALAVELMESFLLIHDDIMDQDELRRGYLTMHKVYENKCLRRYPEADSKRYGESMAIIAGDLLAVLGSEAILKSAFPLKQKISAIERFNSAVINTCFGQAKDVEFSLAQEVSEQQILKLYMLKTALYTIDAPLQIGAMLAGADEKQLKSITHFSIPMGQAFQLQDDILGMFGSEEKLGKPIGSDLKEGKKTLLVVNALEKAAPADRKFMLRCLGNDSLTESDVKKFRLIVEKTGSLDYCRSLACSFMDKARAQIAQSSMRPDAKEFLFAMCDYMIRRSS